MIKKAAILTVLLVTLGRWLAPMGGLLVAKLLALQRSVQQPLGQLLQQPALTGQLHARRLDLVDQLADTMGPALVAGWLLAVIGTSC